MLAGLIGSRVLFTSADALWYLSGNGLEYLGRREYLDARKLVHELDPDARLHYQLPPEVHDAARKLHVHVGVEQRMHRTLCVKHRVLAGEPLSTALRSRIASKTARMQAESIDITQDRAKVDGMRRCLQTMEREVTSSLSKLGVPGMFAPEVLACCFTDEENKALDDEISSKASDLGF